MRIYHLEGFFGELMPRLTLFYPWTAGLALAGVGIFFVSMGDRARGWRWLGMAGGLAAVVLSFSRAGMIALVAAALAYLWLTLPRAWKGLTITAGMVAILAFIMTGNQFAELADDFLDTFASGRHGSSVGRDMIYERSWEGFTHSPILGNGWIGESVHVSEDLPIGSHSSVYGLLYTGGLLTFAAFVVALAVTGSALAAATAGRGGHRPPGRLGDFHRHRPPVLRRKPVQPGSALPAHVHLARRRAARRPTRTVAKPQYRDTGV